MSMNNNVIPLKLYLIDDGPNEPEVRRCGIILDDHPHMQIRRKITEVFPKLTDKVFTLMWKDEDNDDVVVSSDEEMLIALKEIKSDVKKFYIKVKPLKKEGAKEGIDLEVNHPGVYCDSCKTKIFGYRYKCIVCRNYDLCSDCENLNSHPEHPMLRIPNPFIFDRVDLYKLVKCLSSYISTKLEAQKHHSHHRQRHSHDASGDCKKKRKCEKHESGPDTDDSEENCHKKHHHGKWRKMNKCVYSQLINDFFNHFDPSINQPEETAKPETASKPNEPTEEAPQVAYLKTVGKTLMNLLDPLGIDVDFEIRPKNDRQEKQSTPEPKKETPPATPSTSQQKEVRFTTQDSKKETMKEEIDELTKILANQKVNESPEEDGWVSFDELKRKANEVENDESAVSETPKPKESKESSPKASAPLQETQNIYPNISTRMPSNPVVRQALEKMLAMGFTNDGDWLTHLLEAKNGDINQALEVLAPHKGA